MENQLAYIELTNPVSAPNKQIATQRDDILTIRIQSLPNGAGLFEETENKSFICVLEIDPR